MKGACQLIKDYLFAHEMNVSQLARLCDTTSQNLNKKLKFNDMDSAWIARISTALKHDFFADLSLEWKKDNTGTMAVSEPAIGYGKINGPLEDYIEQRINTILEKKEKKNIYPVPAKQKVKQ